METLSQRLSEARIILKLQDSPKANVDDRAPSGLYRAEGMIKNFNTIEEYRNADKSQLLTQSGKTV